MVTASFSRWLALLLVATSCPLICSCKDEAGSGPGTDLYGDSTAGDSDHSITDGSSSSDPSTAGLGTDSNGQDSTFQPDGGSPLGPVTADHLAVVAFDAIPESVFDQVRQRFRLFYGHTSHGSQLVTGMDLLAAQHPTRYALPTLSEESADLGHEGDLGWVGITRAFLDDSDHSAFNVVVWSWCGGVSDNTEEGIDTYLSAMDQLERDYPQVAFVYMTGHRDDSGEDGNLMVRNAQIRSWCQAHDKLLFDFADIESWDPGGTYQPSTTDACEWCSDWCSVHPADCPSCGDCAHSHCFNCYQKGKAFWWLLARMTGWE